MFGHGHGAGGYSGGIGGPQGVMRGGRGADGWDEDYLGKPYDAEVVRRMIPYLRNHKPAMLLAFFCMVLVSISIYIQPLLIGFAVGAGASGDTDRVPWLIGVMFGLGVMGWVAGMIQQLVMAEARHAAALRAPHGDVRAHARPLTLVLRTRWRWAA